MSIRSTIQLEIPVRRVRKSFGLRLGGAFLVAMWFVCGNTAAWASCGDYVRIGNSDAMGSATTDKAMASHRAGSYSTAGASHHQPECRQRPPSIPALPVPSTTTPRMECAALIQAMSLETNRSRAWQHPVTEFVAASFSAERIERPPRAI